MRILLFLVLGSLTAQAAAPSFDCRKAKEEDEKLICASDDLARADVDVAAAFKRASAALGKDERSTLKEAQRAWIRERNTKCGIGSGGDGDMLKSKGVCLLIAYKKRLDALKSTGSGEKAGSGEKPVQKTKDFTVTIHPKLPPFRVRAFFHADEAYATITRLEITKGTEPTPSQGIEVSKISEEARAPVDMEYVEASDMDFDGYGDLSLISAAGATGNISYLYWLYRPATGKFEASEELSSLANATADEKSKTVTSSSKGGHMGAMYATSTYVWERGKLVNVREEVQDLDPKDRTESTYLRVVKERKGGKMVEVSKVRVKIGEDGAERVVK